MIKQKRKSLNMTQNDLAKMLGVSRSTVAMWELGKIIPRPDKLIKLSELFHCTVDDLVKGGVSSG